MWFPRQSPNQHSEVFMNQFIAHSANFLPGYLTVWSPHIFRDLLRCFSNDFKAANNGVSGLLVCHEVIESQPVCERSDVFNWFCDVIEIVTDFPLSWHTVLPQGFFCQCVASKPSEKQDRYWPQGFLTSESPIAWREKNQRAVKILRGYRCHCHSFVPP